MIKSKFVPRSNVPPAPPSTSISKESKKNRAQRTATAALPGAWPGAGLVREQVERGPRWGKGAGRPSESWKAAPGSLRRWHQPQHGKIKPSVTDYSGGPCRSPGQYMQRPDERRCGTKSLSLGGCVCVWGGLRGGWRGQSLTPGSEIRKWGSISGFSHAIQASGLLNRELHYPPCGCGETSPVRRLQV